MIRETRMRTFLLWLAMCGGVAGQTANPYLHWKTYRKADGLPSDKVLTVCVQGDTVWAGTDEGLARFDGAHWRTYTTSDGLCHPVITSLAADADTGDLWIATMGGVCRLSAGRFDTFSQLNSGLANDLVYQVKVIRGNVWMATAAGTTRYNPLTDQWSIFTEANTPMHEIWCYGLTSGPGKVYVAVWGGGVLEYDEQRDHWRDHTDPDREMEIDLFRDDGLNHDVVSTVAMADDGRLWVGTYFGLSTYDGRRWKNYYDHDSPLASNFVNYIGTRGAVAWIGTDRGLNAVDGDVWWTYQRDARRKQGGLAIRRAPNRPPAVFRIQGTLPHDYVLGIDFQGDDLWVATAEGLGHATRNGSASPEPAQPVQDRAGVVTSEPHRSGKPSSESQRRYGNAPVRAIPYRLFAEPYLRFFQTPQPLRGPGRERPAAALPETVRVGVLVPTGDAPNGRIGDAMLRGIRLAIDEANRAGGYRGRPYELVVRPDLGRWGATSNEMVHLAHDDQVWAVIGSIGGDNTHIALRAALKLDMPMVNTGTTDPTLTETGIPWMIRCMADDRQQGYALALAMIDKRKLRRIAVLRENGRYGRLGIAEFRDAARRMKAPLLAELNFPVGAADFDRQLSRIQRVRPDALVLWAGADDAARIVRAVRARKMGVAIFGADRMVSRRFLQAAGAAAEGIIAVSTFNPASDGAEWVRFRDAYRKRYQEVPESFAAHGYDGAKILLAAVQEAGLNRMRIMDALRATRSFQGATGSIVFDTTMADVGPVWLATVEHGRFVFRPSSLRAATAATAADDHGTERGPGRDAAAAAAAAAARTSQSSGAEQLGRTASRVDAMPPKPYLRIRDRPVRFNGPRSPNPAGPTGLVVGAFLPATDGNVETARAVRRGIELAFRSAPQRFQLVLYDSVDHWGKASTALVDMISRQHVLALIGGIDRASTHLAAQVAVKIGVPVLTPTCTDPSVTSVPIPWVFRCALRSDATSAADRACRYPVDAQRMSEFDGLYRSAYGESPDLQAALGYDTAQLLIDTIAGGVATRTALRDALASRPPFAGVTGPILFDNVGDRTGTPRTE